MSLHTLANHIQSAGRGDDTVLVHMTPSEVNGLQALAMAHGGSLTINPETGLPEAGFLRSIMPTLLGFALAPMTGGFSLMGSEALGTAALVGGGYALATGSLQKGLVAGLGAFGGASLAGGLAAAAPAGVGGGMNAPVNVVTGAPMPVGAGNFYNQLNATVGQGATTGAATASTAAAPTTTTLSPATYYASAGNPAAGKMIGVQAAQAAPVVAPPVVGNAPGAAPSVLGDIKQGYQQLGEGAKRVFSDPEKLKAFAMENKGTLGSIGLSALLNREPPRPPEEERFDYTYTPFDYVRPYNPSAIAPGSSAERSYFRAAEGGLATLPVEQMSQQNAMMDNTRYPMAFQQTPTYASPSERPISQNLLYPATDADVTPYSGVPRMASGGVVALAAGGPTQAEINAGNNAANAAIKLINTTIKPPNYQDVKPPTTGFTNTNVVSTYKAALDKELKDYTDARALLAGSLDAKGNPKPGHERAVELLQNAIDGQADDLRQIINFVYDKIPKTDLDFSDPKKAAAITTAQTNEKAEINKLLASYANAAVPAPGIVGLKNSDFAKNLQSKIDAEEAQRLEATIFQTNIAPVLAGVKDTPTPADSIKLNNAMIAAGLIDKQGNVTAKGNQYSGLAGFAANTLKAYQEGEKPLTRAGATSAARAPTYLEGVTKPTDKVALPAGIIYAHQGFNTTVRNLTAADVTSVFEEVVGRKPTAAELQQYVGTKTSPQNFATQMYSAALEHNEKRFKPFTAEEIQAQAKYYWGREMDDGELAGFVKASNAGLYPTFTVLRNALTAYTDKTGKNAYQQNLQAQLDLALKPPSTSAAPVEIADVYNEVLGRKPTKAEYDAAVSGKTPIAALRTNLLNSTEYLEKRIYQPESQPTGIGGSGFAVQQPTTGAPTGAPSTTTGPGTTPISGGTGFTTTPTPPPPPPPPPPPRQLTPEEIAAEQAAREAYQRAYTGYTPTGGGIARPVMDEKTQQDIAAVAGNIYRPQFLPSSETPDIRFIRDVTGQAFPYRDPNKELGLTGLYTQLSQKMPDLRQGLTFAPSQGATLASPFSNVTPGLVTLKSAAVPQPYTPPTPVLPGTTTQQVALTPEEQLLMAQAQALQQNQPKTMAAGGYAGGGYNLGDYSDGGRLLKGPGDGVSDSIPASINNRRPARLADGEFVIPARIVSELGNGSTEAGARQLYAMMDRVQKRRRKTVGKGRVAVDSKARSLLPA